MIMTKKLTKKDLFNMVLEVVENAEVDNRTEMIDFINHELELLARKSSGSAETKTQKENKILAEQLLVALKEFNEPLTITDFQTKSNHEVATLSNQKLSALLKKLVEENRVVKTVEKKKSYFSAV